MRRHWGLPLVLVTVEQVVVVLRVRELVVAELVVVAMPMMVLVLVLGEVLG